MIRRIGPWAALAAAFVVLGSCGREPTGPATQRGALVLPRMADLFASSVLDLGAVRVVLTKPPGEAVVVDTTIPFPANADSLVIVLSVPLERTSESFILRMAVTNAVGDTVFRVGPAPVVATTNPLLPPSEIPAPVYVGVGADAVGVRFMAPPELVTFGQTVPIVAEAFDDEGLTIPGTPIGFELVTLADTLKARFPDRGVGSLTAATTRGPVAIRAYLLTHQSVEHTLTVQPVANSARAMSGNGQVATVGTALASPIVAEVIAADNLGVLGVPVDFRLTRGTDTLAVVRDTTDADGRVSFTPTLGTIAGTYAVSATATVDGGATAIVNFTATAVGAAATRLEFTQQPTNALPLAPIAPAVTVTARDAFGNVASGFVAAVTVALLDDPPGVELNGTVTRAAVGGVATFADLSLTGLGTGLTLLATATGVASDTSAAFDVTVGVATRLEFIQQPTNVTATDAFAPPILVAVRDAGSTTVPTATDLITLTLLENPTGAVLAGPTTVAAVDGVADFTGLSIARAGTGYTLLATASGLDAATSVAFNVTVGPATQLGFYTQPPATITTGEQMNVQVGAYDAGGNLVSSFGGAVTMALGNNPSGATLGGILTWAAEDGVAGFGDLSLDQPGSGYTLTATASGLTAATSNAFDVTLPGNVIAWINASGGDWNTPANWSSGAVPTASDTVAITANGTYTVTIGSGTVLGRVQVGAATGTQTLQLSGGTTSLTDSLLVGANGALSIAGGTLNGSGVAIASGAVTWTAGSLFGGGLLRANGPFLITGAAARSLNDFTLEIGSVGTWTGTAAIASGSGAVLRVLPGALLEAQSTGGLFYDQGGAQTITEVLGTFSRTGGGTDTLRIAGLSGTGLVSVTGGILEARNTGAFSGTITIDAGAELYFPQGAVTLSPTSVVSGSGNVTIGGSANVTSEGSWNIAGTTRLVGGTFSYSGASGTTNAFVMLGGTMGGSGLFTVSGPMTWTAGSLSGGGGTTRVTGTGTLLIDGAATRTLNNHILEIGGAGLWASGARNIASGSGGTIRVLAAGTFDLQGGGGWFWDQGGAQSVFEVLGTVTRTVGTDTMRVPGMSVGVGGSVTASAGVLEARNSGTSAGTLAAESGAELLFTSGTQTLLASAVVSGGGVVAIGNSATVTGVGTWAVTGTTRLSGGTFDYDAPAGSTGTLVMLTGTKAGSGVLDVSSLVWTGGSFSGGGGTTRVASGTISGATSRTLSNHVIEIAGGVDWIGAQNVSSGSGGGVRVLPEGTLDVQGDLVWLYDQGGTQSFLEVQGVLTRTVSAGVAVVPGLSVNGGSLTVTTGVLEARNSGTSSGTLTVTAPAELRFGSGSHTLTSTSTVSGTGVVSITAGTTTSAGAWGITGTTRLSAGTFDFDGTGTTTTFEFTGGAKSGSGTFGVTGAMTWSGGNLQGGDGITRVENGGTLAIQNTTARTLSAHTLEIAGTAIWSDATAISSGSGGTIRVLPTGSLDIQSDPQWFYDQGGTQSMFEVQGSVTRSTSSGTAFVPGLAVTGTLQVLTGVLEARNTGTSSGTLTVTAPAELRFGSGSHTLTATSNVLGTGIVSFTAGTTTAAGAWGITGSTRVTGGTFVYDGASGTTTVLDVLSGVRGGAGLLVATGGMTWSGGNLSGGGGTTRVGPGASLTIDVGVSRTLNAHTLEILGTGTWTGSATLNSGSNAVLRVGSGGTLTLQDSPQFLFNQGGGASILQNQGTLIVSGPGTASVSARFEDSGALSVAGGAILSLTAGGELGGSSMSIDAAGIVRFAGGTFALQPTLNQTGLGAVLLDGGTFSGLAPGDTARFTNLQALSGTLGPANGGVVQVELFTWLGNATLGGGGETYIPDDASAIITGTAGRTLNNHDLVIAGSMIVSDALTINSGSNAVIRILPEGVLSVSPPATTTVSYLFNQGGGASVLDMQGTMALNTAATFQLSAQLQHGGNTAQTLGAWSIAGGGVLGGEVFVDAPASLTFAGGTLILADGLVVSGLGQTTLTTGTLTTAAAADTAEVSRLRLTGGTVDPLGTILVSDLFDWAGNSSISGGNIVALDSALFTGTAGRTLNAATIELRGTTRWLTDFTINSGSVARLLNVADADFEWGGNGDFQSNQGGGQSILENRGALRFTGTGATLISAFVVDTTSNALQVLNGGTVTVQSGGRIGGEVSSSGVLQFGGGTISVQGGASLTGPGVYRVSGGTFTADTADAGAVQVQNLELTGGEMLHEGEVVVNSTMLWTGGELESNTAGEPGVTRIASGATLTISGATVKNIIAHRLTMAAGANVLYGGSGNLQTGSGATIENEGVFDIQGTGSVLWSLGGTAPRFRNLPEGMLLRSGLTSGVVMNLQLENAGGALVAQNDTLRLTGGSVTAFSGNAVAEGAPIKLLGNFTMTDDLTVSGTVGELVVAASTLNVGASTLTISGNLTVNGTGSITSANAAAVIDVAGDATFAGNPTNFSNGILRIGGNFAQGPDGNAAAFTATGTHVTHFSGTERQTVSFANPGTGASRFAALDLDGPESPRRLELLTNVFAGTLRDTSSTIQDSIITAAGALLTTANAAIDNIAFVGTRLTVTNGADAGLMRAIRFDGMDPTATQLQVDLNAGASRSIINAVFATTPTTGLYVVARQMATGPIATLSLPTPVTPASPGSFYQRLIGGGATLPNIVWAGVTLP